MKTISLGSDHAGYELKESIKKFLTEAKYQIIDEGTFSTSSVDYPDFIFPAAENVANGKADLGIVFGGSGNGEAIAANKVKGIRCAVCWDTKSAKLAKEHNNANMISLGARMIGEKEAGKIVKIWLESVFEGGRHIPRIEKLSIYESMKK